MMKKRGVSLIEVILSASMILVVVGIVFTLVIGTSRRINILDRRKVVKDSIERYRSILGGKLRGITSVNSISDDGDELEFTFEEGEHFTSKDARVFLRTVSSGEKQLVIQYDDSENQTDILIHKVEDFGIELFQRNNTPAENLEETGLIRITLWIHSSEEARIKDRFIIKLRKVY